MNKSIAASIVLAVLALAIGAYLYPQLPERMASHWNFQGEVNGYSGKTFGVFFLPLLTLVLIGFFMIIPKIDPLKQNIAEFRKYFDGLVLVFTAFMIYIYLLTLAWSLGYRFDMSQMLSPAFGILFYYMGILIGKSKRNWFIGIRTPWTLSSDKIWDSTHRIGGKLFKACGVVSLLGVFVPSYGLLLVIGPVLAVSLYLVIYSYQEYRKQKT
jgi:uncharacterized membrane protein